MRGCLLASLAATLALQAQPSPHRFTLPNGLQVVHLEDHEHPLVRVRLHLGLEPGDVPGDRQGLPLLAMQMFLHSDAADLRAEAFDRLLEDAGIQLSASAKDEALEWRLTARSRDQDRALSLLADRLLRTVFDPTVLETQRLACWHQAERLDLPPFQRLEAALLQTPGARPTLTSLGAITLEDLLAFRAKVVRPDRALLLIHGDLGLEQAKRLVLLNMGTWSAPELPRPMEPPAGPRPPSPQVPPPAVPMRIPSPGETLRIQAVLPRPAGLAPEAASLLTLLVPGEAALFPVAVSARQGALVATFDAGPETSWAAAWSLLLERLDTLRQRGFQTADLEKAKAAWAAGRSLSSMDAEAQLEEALAQAAGRGINRERVESLTLAQLNAALRAWLDPGKARRGAAGSRERLTGPPAP